MELLSEVKEIPPMMILHGRDDSAVPYQSSESFVQKAQKLHPETKIFYNAVPGCEHGLDKDATSETPWLKEGLEFITPLWLG
jgi:dipeptidyl aminopeptidase/acylaminoacyl peptidase